MITSRVMLDAAPLDKLVPLTTGRLRRSLQDAVREGVVEFYRADELCCRAGEPTPFVFGDAYFNAALTAEGEEVVNG